MLPHTCDFSDLISLNTSVHCKANELDFCLQSSFCFGRFFFFPLKFMRSFRRIQYFPFSRSLCLDWRRGDPRLEKATFWGVGVSPKRDLTGSTLGPTWILVLRLGTDLLQNGIDTSPPVVCLSKNHVSVPCLCASSLLSFLPPSFLLSFHQ